MKRSYTHTLNFGKGLFPMRTTLDRAVPGIHFQIKAGGKEYEFVGRTVNGLYIYRDDQGRLYDRKSGDVHNLLRV